MATAGSERAAVVQVDLPGRLILVARDAAAEPAPNYPGVLVVVAWCPKGRATTFAANDRALSDLRYEVGRLGRKAMPAAVLDPAGAWRLAGVAVEGEGLEDLGAALASCARQDRYRLVDPHGITEVFVRTGFRRTTPASLQEVPHRRCPILEDGQAAPCRDPGGPWVRASMTASLLFRARRHSALRAVGCEDCDPAAPPQGSVGRPVALVAVLDPAPRDRRRLGAVHGPRYGDRGNTPKDSW